MKNLTFGVIGTGYFGRHYLRLLQTIPEVRLLAFSNLLGSLAEPLSGVKGYSNPEELIRDPLIDCVVIATPVSTHKKLAESALQSGKNVLLEKPMVQSLEEAIELQSAVRNSGKIFMVGHQYLYNEYVRRLKAEIDAGGLGEVRYALGLNMYLSPIRHDVGCFWETATHELAILDYLFSPGEIERVSGQAAAFTGMRDDFVSVQITFKGWKGVASIVTSWFSPEKIRKFTFAGTKGMAVFDDREQTDKLKFFRVPFPQTSDTKSTFVTLEGAEIEIPSIATKEPLMNQLQHFIDSVQKNASPLTGIDHGVRITSYLEAISRHVF